MKFALAAHGTRGDIEPCAAVGLELLRRGHDVRIAVPPNLVGFVESAGLSAVAYGPDSQEQLEEDFFRKFWQIQNPVAVLRRGTEYLSQGWAEMSATLKSLAEGADLVLSAQLYQGLAANVAEYHDIPFAALHYMPQQVNGHALPLLPPPLVRNAIATIWWLHWRMTKKAEDAQRDELHLPRATRSSVRRISERGSLEIQAYDKIFFPGLAAEWNGRRPFVGALTMELTSDADSEVASWIAAGTPPIYFGFGSMQVEIRAETIAMIGAACTQLGERALICSATKDLTHIPSFEHVKVVDTVNHAATFPACRGVVHHGGLGTLTAGMRAGVPTLALWFGADQPIWAAQVKRLKVGSARRFSRTTERTLVADLRKILSPPYVARARETSAHMTKSAESVTTAADLLVETAHRRVSS